MLEKIFKLKENGTDVKTEVIAGLTTFMTMAYILVVNSNILADAGMDIFTRGLCLPSDNKMTAEQQDRIIEVIKKCFE